MPFEFITNVPTPEIGTVVPALWVIPFITNWVTVSVFRSTSESSVPSVITFPETGVSSLADTTSSTATGASFTAVTVIARLAVAVAPPASLTV